MVSRGLTISHSLDDDYSYWRLAMRNSVTPADCPPESGGQHDRDSSRDRAGGGSRAALFKNAFWNISFVEPPLASSQRTRWRCPCILKKYRSKHGGCLKFYQAADVLAEVTE